MISNGDFKEKVETIDKQSTDKGFKFEGDWAKDWYADSYTEAAVLKVADIPGITGEKCISVANDKGFTQIYNEVNIPAGACKVTFRYCSPDAAVKSQIKLVIYRYGKEGKPSWQGCREIKAFTPGKDWQTAEAVFNETSEPVGKFRIGFAVAGKVMLSDVKAEVASDEVVPLVSNGDFKEKVEKIDKQLMDKGFKLDGDWVKDWYADDYTEAAVLKVTDISGRPGENCLSVANDKGFTQIYNEANIPAGAYKVTFHYCSPDAAVKSQIKLVIYRYGKEGKPSWQGCREIKAFTPGKDWQTAEAVFSETSEPVGKFRIGFAVAGKVTLADVKVQKVDMADEQTKKKIAFNMTADWEIVCKDGAKSEWSMDKTCSRTKNGALKISKLNADGYIVIRGKQPLSLENGVKYTFKGYYHTEDAPVMSQMLFRLGEKDTVNFKMPYGLFSYMGFNHMANSLPGQWQSRILNFTCADQPDTDVNLQRNYPSGIYPYIILHGNAFTVNIDQVEIYPQRENIRNDREKYNIPYTREQVLEHLKKREPLSSSLEIDVNTVKLQQNGKYMAPVMYMASENHDLVGDFAGFGKAGIDLAIAPVKLNDHQQPERSVWLGNNQYNFKAVDEWLFDVLRKNPDAKLIVHFWIYAYDKWMEENPDECVMNRNGERAFTYSYSSLIFGYSNDLQMLKSKSAIWMPSYHSEKWRQDTNAAIKAIAGHLRNSPFANAIAGFNFFSGIDGRLQPVSDDYSPASIKRFIGWCEEKYQTPAQLSAAWSQKFDSLEQVGKMNFPSSAAIYDPGIIKPYTDNISAIDFKKYIFNDTWTLVDSWAETAKKSWPRPVITCAYRDLDRAFLNCKYLDLCGNDLMYPLRHEGIAGAAWYPVKTDFRKKLWCMDIDLRSFAGPQEVDEEYEHFVGAATTKEKWLAMHDKLIGICLAGNSGYWYYDMLAFFQDPFILEHIKATAAVGRKLAAMEPANYRPDMAVVISGDGKLYSNVLLNACSDTIGFWGFNYIQGMSFATSGVPYDMIYLEDLAEYPELQNYKMYVFAHTVNITTKQREVIEKKLKKNGRTLVWMYDSGYISEREKGLKNICDITGMTIGTEEKYVRLMPEMKYNPAYPLNVLPFQSGTELMYFNFKQHGLAASSIAPPQPFWIEDADAVSFAVYKENGRNAMAAKKFPEWTSIYIAAPNSLGNDLLNQLAQKAGAYICGKPGQSIHLNDRFASIHALRTEEFKLQLPAGRKTVKDAFTGRIISENSSECSLKLAAGKTYWYFFE